MSNLFKNFKKVSPDATIEVVANQDCSGAIIATAWSGDEIVGQDSFRSEGKLSGAIESFTRVNNFKVVRS